jgi:peptide deformylase
MSILLQIAQLGNPVLRQKTELVTTIEDHDSQDLIDDMLDTLADVVGLGLAAPQVYRSLRLFIMACHPTPNYPAAPEMDPMAIINPEILSKSADTVKGWEGCLSIPGLRGKVPRHRSIEVTYFKQDGRKIQTKLTGMPPIIF